MKTSDLYDYVIFQDNTQLAFGTLAEEMDRKEFLILMFHVAMKWQNTRDCTKDMVADIATILQNDLTFYKYTN